MNSKSAEADRILKSDLWKEVIASSQERLKREWAEAKSASHREMLWHRYQAVSEPEVELKRIRDAGVFEDHRARRSMEAG